MRVIITGGTGLIGTTLARDLVADGHEVIALSRKPSEREAPAGVKLEKWDAKTGDSWHKFITADTAIVNLAGAGIADERWSEERKRIIVDSRVNAAEAVIHAIEKSTEKPNVVIQSSAVGYYGPSGDDILTEDSPAGEDFLAEVCVQWEDAIKPVYEQHNIRTVIIRTGVVLSLEGGAFPKQLLPFRLYAGGPIGSGQQWFPWIHIKDEVRAIRFLIDNEDASGVYNLSAPHPVTNQEFTKHLARTMNRPGILPVPAFALQLLFGEMATVLLDGQRAVPQHLEDAGFNFEFAEPEAALRDLLGKPETTGNGHAAEETPHAEHAEAGH
jgi:uncharacterized protein